VCETKDEETMRVAFAKGCGFKSDLSGLHRVAERIGVSLAGCTTYVDSLCTYMSKVLHISKLDALVLAKARLALCLKRRGTDIEEVLEIDEAAKCLERDDEEFLHKQQAALAKELEDEQMFVTEWRAMKKVMKQKEKDAAADPKPPPNKKHKPAIQSLPKSYEMQDQAELKVLMPPESRLWKKRKDSSWNSRVQDLPSHSARISKHGNRAPYVAISEAWKDHCLLEGIDLCECPMKGLIFA